MALFFDLKILEELSCKDYNKMFALLTHHYNKKTIPSKRDKYPPARVSLVGYSYLLNPKPFLEDRVTDIIYKVQYLKLAAARDYALYKKYKYKGLQRSYYPDMLVENIKHNPLLKFTDTDLLFIYEESI